MADLRTLAEHLRVKCGTLGTVAEVQAYDRWAKLIMWIRYGRP